MPAAGPQRSLTGSRHGKQKAAEEADGRNEESSKYHGDENSNNSSEGMLPEDEGRFQTISTEDAPKIEGSRKKKRRSAAGRRSDMATTSTISSRTAIVAPEEARRPKA